MAFRESLFDLNRSDLVETLKKADDSAIQKKKSYFATNRLAFLLHQDKVKKWKLRDWERFNNDHESPFEELEDLEGAEKVNSDFRKSLSK